MKRILHLTSLPLLTLPLLLFTQEAEGSDTSNVFEPPTYDSVELAAELIYPPKPLRSGMQQQVTAHILIDSTGRRITYGEERLYGFLRAVEEALAQHDGFRPGRLNDIPVESLIVLDIDFSIVDGKGVITITTDSTAYFEKPKSTALHFIPDAIAPTYDRTKLKEHLRYPENARARKIEGTVFIVVKIDTAGTTVSAAVEKSLDPELDQVALEAVRTLTFTPARQNGAPVNMKLVVPVTFRLEDESKGE